MRRALWGLATFVFVAVASALLVSWKLGAESYRGAVSDHFDGRRFSNLDPTPDKSLGDLWRWQVTADKGPWAAWIDEPPGPKPDPRVADGSIRVTWINHATLLVQLDGVNILTDPIYSERASPFPWIGPKRHRVPGIRFEDLPPIDGIVVSHNHYDHMDVPTLRRLTPAGAAPTVLVGLGNDSYLTARGVQNVKGIDWWDTHQVGTVHITAVPVQHWSARARSDRRHTLWAGYVIQGPSGSVYFGGDTGYGRHFVLTRSRIGAPDVALLPIGAYRPTWFMRDNHMAPAEAVQAAKDLGATIAIPMHFDTWQLGDDGDQEPLNDLEKALAVDTGARATWRVIRHGIAHTIRPIRLTPGVGEAVRGQER